MIEKIEIHNFQSHKATVLELDSKVNTLQGNSDCGKSAVLRALHWLIFNPAGDYFISDWARNGARQVAPCEVIVHANGHKITRRRDKDFNGYYLDDEVFEATRNTVPQKILDILNLSEVNVQRQLDPPFLLSMSAGEVSRYINSLVNLSRIDTWIKASNSRDLELKRDVEAAVARVDKAQKLVESFSFLSTLEVLANDITAKDKSLTTLWKEVDELQAMSASHKAKQDELASLPDIAKLDAILAGVSESTSRQHAILMECQSLDREISEHSRNLSQLGGLPDIDRVSEILSEMPGIDSKAKELGRESVVLAREIEEYGVNKSRAGNIPDALFDNVEQLERWKEVQRNLRTSEQELANTLSDHSKLTAILESVMHELPGMLVQLENMVCPLCGRRGGTCAD